MRIRLTRCAATYIVLITFSMAARAQTSEPAERIVSPGAGQAHNLEGIWSGRLGTVAGTNKNPDVAPMLPWAQSKFDTNTTELKNGRSLTGDPTFHCDPSGVPRVYAIGTHPFEIVQTPSRIFLFYEGNHMWRTVWMDGRKLPRDYGEPLWMGYSVGRWEGDDLIIDTAGFNDKTWIDAAGSPHSTALHVVERFHRIDNDVLQLDVTIDDPRAYAHPWGMKGVYTRKPTWEIGEEFCVSADQLKFRKHVLYPNATP
jgi:hypothetical protein